MVLEDQVTDFWELERETVDDEPVTDPICRVGAGDYILVGNGRVNDARCGTFKGWRGCVRDHSFIKLDGNSSNGMTNFAGKVYVERAMHTCHRAECPICYRRGFAVREAQNMEIRLKEAAKKYHEKVEHVVASMSIEACKINSKKDAEKLRRKIIVALYARGVIGGSPIFHGFRYDHDGKYWYWSPHFHVLGLIKGGYKCRKCPHVTYASNTVCAGCDEFEARTRRLWEKDGVIVKIAVDEDGVARERDTVGGTAWYQLHHAAILRGGSERYHVVTWFGVCSYRKLKISQERMKELRSALHPHVCPLCQHDIGELRYFGDKVEFFKLVKSAVTDGRDKEGRVLWVLVEKPSERYERGHYDREE